LLFREFEEKVEKRQIYDIPDNFSGNRHAQAYFGVFKKLLPEAFASGQDPDLQGWTELAFTIDNFVNTAVAEHSINPQNIEAEIRKKLLPIIFKACKDIGAGMDQAKAIVDLVVQITRVGLNQA
jgi:type I restriction enzyme R subunit